MTGPDVTKERDGPACLLPVICSSPNASFQVQCSEHQGRSQKGTGTRRLGASPQFGISSEHQLPADCLSVHSLHEEYDAKVSATEHT